MAKRRHEGAKQKIGAWQRLDEITEKIVGPIRAAHDNPRAATRGCSEGALAKVRDHNMLSEVDGDATMAKPEKVSD